MLRGDCLLEDGTPSSFLPQSFVSSSRGVCWFEEGREAAYDVNATSCCFSTEISTFGRSSFTLQDPVKKKQ